MPRFVQYDTTLVLPAPRNAPQCTAVPSVPLVSQGSLVHDTWLVDFPRASRQPEVDVRSLY